jgi:hypothetical protein
MNKQNLVKTYEVKTDGKTTKWYFNGSVLHREEGPAIETTDGYKEWYLNGKLHREDGPAVEYADGPKYWYLNGKCHREDGPAVEYADGHKEWYLNGKEYNNENEYRIELERRKISNKIKHLRKLNKSFMNAISELNNGVTICNQLKYGSTATEVGKTIKDLENASAVIQKTIDIIENSKEITTEPRTRINISII